jgi:hypothetical protein
MPAFAAAIFSFRDISLRLFEICRHSHFTPLLSGFIDIAAACHIDIDFAARCFR